MHFFTKPLISCQLISLVVVLFDGLESRGAGTERLGGTRHVKTQYENRVTEKVFTALLIVTSASPLNLASTVNWVDNTLNKQHWTRRNQQYAKKRE